MIKHYQLHKSSFVSAFPALLKSYGIVSLLLQWHFCPGRNDVGFAKQHFCLSRNSTQQAHLTHHVLPRGRLQVSWKAFITLCKENRFLGSKQAFSTPHSFLFKSLTTGIPYRALETGLSSAQLSVNLFAYVDNKTSKDKRGKSLEIVKITFLEMYLTVRIDYASLAKYVKWRVSFRKNLWIKMGVAGWIAHTLHFMHKHSEPVRLSDFLLITIYCDNKTV